MTGEISIQALVEELAQEGKIYTVTNVTQLIKRGHLPRGRKVGTERLLPYVESKLILTSHQPGKHWVENRPRPGKRKNKVRVDTTPNPTISASDIQANSIISWSDVL